MNLYKNCLMRWLLRCLVLALSCAAGNASAAGAAMAARQTAWQDLGHGAVLQSTTGLRWTKQDNGRDIDWSDAKSWCARLGDGWRLPGVDELRKMVAEAEQAGTHTACGKAVCMSPAQFHLSAPWHWSGAPLAREETRDADELAWGVTLVNGRPTMGLRMADYGARALCVHSRASR